MSKKPKCPLEQMMLKNAKRNKVSKSIDVRYPNTEGVKRLFGIGKKRKNNKIKWCLLPVKDTERLVAP